MAGDAAFEIVAHFTGDAVAEKIENILSKIKAVVEWTMRQAQAGDRNNDVLAHQIINVEAASQALGGQVAKIDLVIQANRAHQAGLQITATQYGQMARLAREFAEATGGDAAQALETLTSAIIRGNERGLKQFGLQAGTTEEILASLQRRVAGLAPVVEGAGDAVSRFETSLHEVNAAFQEGIDQSAGLERMFVHLSDTVDEMTGSAHLMGAAFGEAITMLSGLPGAVAVAAGAIDTLGERWDMATMGALNYVAAQRIAAGITAVTPVLGMNAADIEAMTRDKFKLADATSTRPRRSGGRAAPTSGSAEDSARFARSVDLDAQFERLEAAEEVAAKEREQMEGHQAFVIDLAEARRKAEEKNAEDRARFEEDQLDQQRRWHQQDLEEQERFSAARMAAMQQDAAAAGHLAQMGAQLLGMGESDKLFVLGLSEAVQAAVHLATFDYMGAAMHALASAIAFKGSVDVAAASGGGRSSRSSAGSSAGGGGGSGPGAGSAFASTSGSGGGGGSGGGTVIHQYNFGGTLAGRRDLDDFIHEVNVRNGARGRKAA